jgi:hypothetical protein
VHAVHKAVTENSATAKSESTAAALRVSLSTEIIDPDEYHPHRTIESAL